MGWNHQLDIHRTATRILFRWTDDESCWRCVTWIEPTEWWTQHTNKTNQMTSKNLSNRGLGIALLREWKSRQLYGKPKSTTLITSLAETTGTYSASKKEMTRLEGTCACFLLAWLLAIEPRNHVWIQGLNTCEMIGLEIFIHWHLPGAKETLRDGPRIEKTHVFPMDFPEAKDMPPVPAHRRGCQGCFVQAAALNHRKRAALNIWAIWGWLLREPSQGYQHFSYDWSIEMVWIPQIIDILSSKNGSLYNVYPFPL